MPQARKDSIPIKVRQSTIHGKGAFATRALEAGDVVGEYTGRRYAAEEVSERDWDHALTFLFGLSDGSVLDGAEGGNKTRHINHSCAPNCAAYEIESPGGELRIVIEALRRIEVAEELFLDYSLDAGSGAPEDFSCRCGAAACRGTLVGLQPAASLHDSAHAAAD
jgi:uncharacterized protein